MRPGCKHINNNNRKSYDIKSMMMMMIFKLLMILKNNAQPAALDCLKLMLQQRLKVTKDKNNLLRVVPSLSTRGKQSASDCKALFLVAHTD